MTQKEKHTLLRLRVQPMAHDDRIEGFLEDGTLKMSVRAAPEKGKANRSVIRLLARRLGLASNQITIVSGLTSRRKSVHLTGLDEGQVRQMLAQSPSIGK